MSEVNSSQAAFDILKDEFNPYAEEVWILCLDTHLQLIRKEMIFRGTANTCLVHPRDIFRTLIVNNACSFVMAHNHPSLQVLPSEQDLVMTRKIRQLAKLFEIRMNDHIIFTNRLFFSMADSGLFKRWRA